MKRKVLSIILSMLIAVQGIAPVTAEEAVNIEEEILIEDSGELPDEEPVVIEEPAEELPEDYIEEPEVDLSEGEYEEDLAEFAEEEGIEDELITQDVEPVGSELVEEPVVEEVPIIETEEEVGPGDVTQVGTIVKSGSCGDNLTWVLTDDGTLTISGTGNMWNWNVDDVWYPSDPSPWFKMSDIKKIMIEPGVTSIGDYAFFGCIELTSVMIPDSVTRIGVYAISNCMNLPSVTIPGSVTTIGDAALFNCHSLTSVTIPDSVTKIGYMALCTCSSLTSVTIPDSVTSIGDAAFYACSSLTSVTIPDSVTSIGEYAFGDCSSLTSVTIPDSMTSIGHGVFKDCSSLTSVTIPDSVTSIGESAFSNCSNLTSVTLPDSVTSIGGYAFSDCSSLTSMTLPNSVTSIGGYAFNGSSLTSVTIPDSMTSIGYAAFGKCGSLTSVTIPDSVTSIGGYAFRDCSSLTSVTIPSSVTSIGESAFRDCDSLTSVTIPGSVASIGGSAFRACNSLTSVTILNGVRKSIKEYAFADCADLKRILIPASVTDMYSNSLSGSSPTIYCYSDSYADFWAFGKEYPIVYLDGGDEDSIRVITSNPESLNMVSGDSVSVKLDVFPTTDLLPVWTSSDSNIASVEDGTITANGGGEAVITVSIGGASTEIPVHVYTRVTDFQLPDEMWMVVHEDVTIPVNNIYPEGAVFKLLSWQSSDTNLATVNEEGTVSSQEPLNDVVITATTDDGISRSCTVHICYPVTRVEFSDEQLRMNAGESRQLNVTVTANTSTYTNKLVHFSTSDSEIATVDENGYITAVKAGKAEITAYRGDYSDSVAIYVNCDEHVFGDWRTTKEPTTLETGIRERTCSVCGAKEQEEIPKISGTIKLSATEITLLPEQSKRITVSGLTSGDKVESWKSADTSIATVTSIGKITAVKQGTTTVTVTLKSGTSAVVKVTVERRLFSDVADSSLFYYDAVYWAVDNGITTGYDDNTFRPNNNCNRAAVVTFLWRLAGKPEPAKMATFNDMTGNTDFDKAISWAAEKGITTGYAGNLFKPWATCNRAAIVTFLWRYAGKPAPSKMATFNDMTNNSDFDKAISWAAERGITTGYNDNTFRPYNQCLRLAVVSFLYRYAHL